MRWESSFDWGRFWIDFSFFSLILSREKNSAQNGTKHLLIFAYYFWTSSSEKITFFPFFSYLGFRLWVTVKSPLVFERCDWVGSAKQKSSLFCSLFWEKKVAFLDFQAIMKFVVKSAETKLYHFYFKSQNQQNEENLLSWKC